MIKKKFYKSKLCIENKISTENTNSDNTRRDENKISTENTNKSECPLINCSKFIKKIKKVIEYINMISVIHIDTQ